MAKEKIEKPQSLEKTLWAAADKLIGAVMPHDYIQRLSIPTLSVIASLRIFLKSIMIWRFLLT